MNLLIQNENARLFDSLSINIIKTLNGEFTKSDLEKLLINLYFNKAIIDITAIKNYYDYNSLFEFLSYFSKDKVIILLNDSELVNSKDYLSHLVKEGYYSFTRNVSGVSYLVEHPNSFSDVEKYTLNNTMQSILYNPLNSNGANNTNTNKIEEETVNYSKNNNQKVIGIKNLTEHAGATTLMYMLVKHLRFNYKVKGIELLKQDSLYFRCDDITHSTSLDDLKMRIKTLADKEVIIVDLNEIDGNEVCDEILYLVDPGIVKLNKLLKGNKNLNFSKGKIILNRSALKDEELSNFEYETKIKVFYNLSNIHDRKERLQSIDLLLAKLGFKKQSTSSGLFGIFK